MENRFYNSLDDSVNRSNVLISIFVVEK